MQKNNYAKYAHAYFNFVKDKASQKNLIEELHTFKKIYAKSPELISALAYGRIDAARVLAQFSAETQNFLKILIKDKAILAIDKIYAEFMRMQNIERNQAYVTISSPKKLTEKQLNTLTSELKKIIQGKDLILRREINPKLIDGLKIDYAGRSLDLSVLTKLKEMFR